VNDGTLVMTVLLAFFLLGGVVVVLRALKGPLKGLRAFLAMLQDQIEAAQKAQQERQAGGQTASPVRPKKQRKKRRGAQDLVPVVVGVEAQGRPDRPSREEPAPVPRSSAPEEDRRTIGLRERFIWSEIVGPPVSMKEAEEEAATQSPSTIFAEASFMR
jgi:hypothetical protein